MAALATITDVQAVLGRTLTAEESAKVDAALDAASAFVRAYTGRRYEIGAATVLRRSRGGRIRLDDAATVSEVRALDSDGNVSVVDATSYTLRGSVIYGISGSCWFEVDYTSSGDVPADVVTVVAAMAARELTSVAPKNAKSYTVSTGPFSEQAAFDQGADPVEASVSERRILDRFRLRRTGSVRL